MTRMEHRNQNLKQKLDDLLKTIHHVFNEKTKKFVPNCLPFVSAVLRTSPVCCLASGFVTVTVAATHTPTTIDKIKIFYNRKIISNLYTVFKKQNKTKKNQIFVKYTTHAPHFGFSKLICFMKRKKDKEIDV